MSSPDVLDLDAFRAIHPWPKDLRKYGKPLEWLWYFDLEGDIEAIWNQLSDTSRFNRALGLGEMKFHEQKGVLHGETRMGGIRQTWIEEPWDWVTGRWLQNVRRYSRGLAHVSRGIYWFERLGSEQVRVYIYFGWIPRGWLGGLVLRIGMPILRKDFARLMADLAREAGQAAHPRPAQLAAPAGALGEAGQARLTAIREALAGRLDSTDVLDRLLDYIATGDELDLYRIQIPALARSWSMAEDELLRLCLHATREGLLKMSWDVVCPHCRGVREEASSLGKVPKLGTCEVCDIDFTTDKESAIEVTFHVHPAIRDIPKRYFCSAEPASKMHIRVQVNVPPGAEQTIEPYLEPGRYRLRLRGQEKYRFLDITENAPDNIDNVDINNNVDNASDGNVDADQDSAPGADGPGTFVWRAGADSTGDVCAGTHPRVHLINDTEDQQQYVIEAVQWVDLALRPVRLFNFQEFRDLFSEEYLSADVQLSVGEQTILFTDVVGSTRFYAHRGDPEAFMEIKKHFVELQGIVEDHHGAVVKTIGDAIMAAFGDPGDAIVAARRIHERFHKDRDDTPIRLRVSLNTGPCIAVNLNSNIDYFGSTVNLAAKLQACAGAGQIVMSQAVVEGAGGRDRLQEQGGIMEDAAYHSDALGQDVPIVRWSIYS